MCAFALPVFGGYFVWAITAQVTATRQALSRTMRTAAMADVATRNRASNAADEKRADDESVALDAVTAGMIKLRRFVVAAGVLCWAFAGYVAHNAAREITDWYADAGIGDLPNAYSPTSYASIWAEWLAIMFVAWFTWLPLHPVFTRRFRISCLGCWRHRVTGVVTAEARMTVAGSALAMPGGEEPVGTVGGCARPRRAELPLPWHQRIRHVGAATSPLSLSASSPGLARQPTTAPCGEDVAARVYVVGKLMPQAATAWR